MKCSILNAYIAIINPLEVVDLNTKDESTI
jgi:hypothetical protein